MEAKSYQLPSWVSIALTLLQRGSGMFNDPVQSNLPTLSVEEYAGCNFIRIRIRSGKLTNGLPTNSLSSYVLKPITRYPSQTLEVDSNE